MSLKLGLPFDLHIQQENFLQRGFMLRKPPHAKFMYKKAMYMFLTGFIIYNMHGRWPVLPSEDFCKPEKHHVEKNKMVMAFTYSLLQIKKS